MFSCDASLRRRFNESILLYFEPKTRFHAVPGETTRRALPVYGITSIKRFRVLGGSGE